jgi:RNA polymerase sigma-70 factor (ECF subfamily)
MLDQMYRMNETGNADRVLANGLVQPTLLVSDESLVEAVRGGDDAAFEQIFERHRRRITRMVARFFKRPERVEEILQEVFIKVYFALDAYSSEKGPSFSAWLSKVAINSCYDELRRARRRPENSIADITSEEVLWLTSRLESNSRQQDAESAAVSRDLANKLLARLSPEDRVVLTLLDAEELSVAEIASLLGWKVSKVKVRAHRARHALRRVLGEFV